MIMPQHLPPGQKPPVLFTHDESIFNANDGIWVEGGKQPLRPKARGKSLVAPDPLTPGGRPIQYPTLNWLHDFCRAGMLQSTLSMAKTGVGRDMVDQTVKCAIPIFKAVFPDYQAVFCLSETPGSGA